jgi:hypothetical protein
MRRILISLLLSIFFFILVLSVSFVPYELQIIDFEKSQLIAFPIRFPFIIYLHFRGKVPDPNFFEIIIVVVLILFDIVFYVLIFYVLLTFINKFKKKQITDKITNPPEPPVFD